METNVGGYDRTGRFVIGAVLVLAGIASYAGFLPAVVGELAQALVLAVVGLVLLVTGYTRKCPIHSAVGMNTYEGGKG